MENEILPSTVRQVYLSVLGYNFTCACVCVSILAVWIMDTVTILIAESGSAERVSL